MMVVIDPFHNRIVFHQPVADEVEPRPSEAAAPIELTYDLDCSVGGGLRRVHPADRRVVAPGVRARRSRAGRDRGRGRGPGPDAPRRRHDVPLGDGDRLGAAGHYAQTFTLAQDPEHPSTLSIRLEPTGANGRRHPGSRVHFAHGGWTAGNVAGRARFTEWSILLDRFAAVADGRPVPDVPAYVTEGGGPG